MPNAKRVRLLKKKLHFKGPLFSVFTETIKEPESKKPARRDTVRHGGSVVVAAVDSKQRLLLVRQYRHAAGAYLWELPAGTKDPKEGFLTGAKRELLEETGLTAKKWKRILRFWVSPGFLDEVMEVFLAEQLTQQEAQLEEDENIEARWFSLPEAVRMARTGKIQDAKTVAAILWLARR